MRSLFKQVELGSAERDKIQSTVNKPPSFPLALWRVCLLLQTFACQLIPFSSWLLFGLHGLLCSIDQTWEGLTLCHMQEPRSTQSLCLEIATWPEALLASPVPPTVHLLPEGCPCPRVREPGLDS